MSADIFISYRGADRVLARKLENRLRSRWGSRVFRDETGVTSGRGWVKELNDALGKAQVIVALVGPGWHLSSDPKAEDWVRKELATAVEGAKPILPVLVGDSEELRPKLAAMPQAFQTQAVVVGPELAGFDLHRIAQALGRLGAFHTEDAWTLAARRDEMVPKQALADAEQAIDEGKSVLVVGSSGSGRNALVQRLVKDLVEAEHLVATYGLGGESGTRHTHAVIAGWLRSLGDTFRDLTSPYAVSNSGRALVKAVLEAGPDLLSRGVVRASTLLPLGGTRHDQMILEAVRRSTDRWAPFPPTRLQHQARQVLESLMERLHRNGAEGESVLGEKRLILVVDHFDTIDSNSQGLICDLLARPMSRYGDKVQFILAAYETGLSAGPEVNWVDGRPPDVQTKIDIKEGKVVWGDHIQPWLDAHHIELADDIRKLIETERNPYRALARLWYLVDNGLVREPPQPPQPKKRASSPRGEKVRWEAADAGERLLTLEELLTEERLLDHLIEEHVPVGFRDLVEAGALMGRTFSFHAAYAAIDPPPLDQSVREREAWLDKARAYWDELKHLDPERSVLSCSESDAGELLVSFAQADLIGHLRNRIGPKRAREFHERLARYLVDPIERLDRGDYGDQYHRADLAAEHWSLAGRPRDAADAHRHAAQIAERSLAYGESRKHYHSAIRLYTQLLAEQSDPERDHEDLLILANCFYRVGQTTRLSGKAGRSEGKSDDEPWGAIDYLERALERLVELKSLLLKDEPERWPDGITGPCSRGIPGPNLVRHHLRVYHAVSGHVHLELAQCYESSVEQCRANAGDELHSCPSCRDNIRALRDHLFDTLRHAEAAEGEAGSRWLLASASARLAALLADEALRTEGVAWGFDAQQAAEADSQEGDRGKQAGDARQRAKELAVEAFFHIERVTGLQPYTTEEEREFAEPVSLAWRSAGRLFRHHALDARIAEWCFLKMNDHNENVSATVDMVTDRWLGGFLLSICKPGEDDETLAEARRLLLRHRDWAIESGIVHWRTPAHLRLYLLELVAGAGEDSQSKPLCPYCQQGEFKRCAQRHFHLHAAERDAQTPRDRRECRLMKALEKLVSADDRLSAADEREVAELLANSLPELHGALPDPASEEADGNRSYRAIISSGVARIAAMLLRRCPLFVHSLERLLGWYLADEDCDHRWIERADQYSQSLQRPPLLDLSPCIDRCVDRLAQTRLLPKVYHQAIATKNEALRLVEIHEQACTEEEGVELNVLRRDVEYAAFMHDWYRGTDPARLLTLASEWNLQELSGEEWSNPGLLQGRLASAVLKTMYDAERVLGTSRYKRITAMVDNCVVGRTDATALSKIFFLANANCEWRAEDEAEDQRWYKWRTALLREDIDTAYELAIREMDQVPWDLGYVRDERPAGGTPSRSASPLPDEADPS